MLVFIATISPSDIARYMATVIVPEYFRNLKLEPVQLNPAALNYNGTQPLRLEYTATGRREEFWLKPEEHAMSLLLDVLPSLIGKKIEFIEDAVLWTWDAEAMKIFFRFSSAPCVTPSVDPFPEDDSYVSVSRGEIFLSFSLFRRFFAWRFAQLGLPFPEETETVWDGNVGGLTCQAENVAAQFLLSDANSLQGILRFAGLENVLQHVQTWVVADCETLFQYPVEIRDEGVALSLERK